MSYRGAFAALTVACAAVVQVQASYSSSSYLMYSTLSEYCVSLNSDGTCGAVVTYTTRTGPPPIPLPLHPTTIYAYRPGLGPTLISGALQYCRAPRMSADGRCVAFWAEYQDGPGYKMRPYVAVYPPDETGWTCYPVPIDSTIAAFEQKPGDAPPTVAVTDYPDMDHPPIVVFQDPIARAIPPETSPLYHRLMTWTLGADSCQYLPSQAMDGTFPWVNSNPWDDPLGLVVTYCGSGPGTTSWRIYRYYENPPSGTPNNVCLSVNSTTGALANSTCLYPQASGDSRYVVYQTTATNLDGTNPLGFTNVFVCDTQTGTYGTTTRAYDYANDESLPVNKSGNVEWPTISYDGNWIAFASGARGLLSGDYPKGFFCGVFLVSRANRSVIELATMTIETVPKRSNGARPSVANDAVIGFDSAAKYMASGSDPTTDQAILKTGHS